MQAPHLHPTHSSGESETDYHRKSRRLQHYLLDDTGDRVISDRSRTGKQSAPETGSHSPSSLCSGVAGCAPVGTPVDVALLGHLDSGVQDQVLCFWGHCSQSLT